MKLFTDTTLPRSRVLIPEKYLADSITSSWNLPTNGTVESPSLSAVTKKDKRQYLEH